MADQDSHLQNSADVQKAIDLAQKLADFINPGPGNLPINEATDARIITLDLFGMNAVKHQANVPVGFKLGTNTGERFRVTIEKI